MKINKIILRDFRNFSGPHTFEFKDGVNLITGLPNTGKTSLMNFLCKCLCVIQSPAARTKNPGLLFEYTDVSNPPQSPRAACVYGSMVTQFQNVEGESQWDIYYDGKRAMRKMDHLGYGEFDNILGRLMAAPPVFAFYSSDRHFTPEPYKISGETPKYSPGMALLAALNVSTTFTHLRKWVEFFEAYKMRDSRDNPESRNLPSYIDVVDLALSRLSPEIKGISIKNNSMSISVRHNIYNRGNDTTVYNTALHEYSGVNYDVLLMCIDFAFRLALSSPVHTPPDEVLSKKAVMLVDRVDRGDMLPSLICNSVTSVFPNVQLIATSLTRGDLSSDNHIDLE